MSNNSDQEVKDKANALGWFMKYYQIETNVIPQPLFDGIRGMNVKKIQEIYPFSFYPVPKVKSAILVFEPKKNFYKIKDCKNLEYVTQVFFNFRRKKIKKSLNILFGNYEKISKKLNIDFNKRPQNLEPDTYLRLCTEYEKTI